MKDIAEVCISLHATLRVVMAKIDRNGKGIALVVDDSRYLLFTITDGDLRRAVLNNFDLDTTVKEWAAHIPEQGNQNPLTMLVGTSEVALVERMKREGLRHIPLLNDNGQVVDLAVLDELVTDEIGLQAMIMAGGAGIRLRPLTDDLPKPMLPVGDRPLMERIIGQLRETGIRHVNIATHYKPEKIVEHFGNGAAYDVELTYVNETRPLGTAGALGLMAIPTETILVINGDILTQVDFRSMLNFHREANAEMTIAVRRYEMQVPYGVVESDGQRVRCLREKPQMGFLVNAGIYLLEPSIYDYIPHGKPFNMTDLIQWLLEAGRNVVSFPILEYWLDIGQHADYAKAQEDSKQTLKGIVK